jgi:membrane-associated protein
MPSIRSESDKSLNSSVNLLSYQKLHASKRSIVVLAMLIFPVALVSLYYIEDMAEARGMLPLYDFDMGIGSALLSLAAKTLSTSSWAAGGGFIGMLLHWGGAVGIALIIFVETGMFFGFIFPGDSLLITAGILAAEGEIDLGLLIALSTLAAIVGDQVNYTLGIRLGKSLVTRYSRFQTYLDRAQVFYDRHGARTITLARFVPVVRTFAPAIAGAANMRYKSFTEYNVLGGIAWVVSMTLTGYALGNIPHVKDYLPVVIALVVLVSLVPSYVEWRKIRRQKKQKT